MNSYPKYVTGELRPLVFLTGHVETEPDIHDRLIRMVQNSYRESDVKDKTSISFHSVDLEQSMPEKKPSKESASTAGLLKFNWPMKHFELVPSVVVLTVPFNMDWPNSEWARKETSIQEMFHKLKLRAAPRDVRVITLVIKIGVGSTDKEAMDERLSSLKRHLQLDSRTFQMLTSANIAEYSSVAKKVSKHIREFSTQYYLNKVKTYKSLEKGIGERYRVVEESILSARYTFKTAFFYEFQGQLLQALRYYRQCYVALGNCIDAANEHFTDQVKAVAEVVHVKICYVLFLTNAIGEAFQQFKAHIRRYTHVYCEFSFTHHAWIANQYVVLAELLEMFNIQADSTALNINDSSSNNNNNNNNNNNISLPDADAGYYYQNAARFSQKRQFSYERTRAKSRSESLTLLRKSNGSDRNEERDRGTSLSAAPSAVGTDSSSTEFRGLMILPPKYIGAALRFLDVSNVLHVDASTAAHSSSGNSSGDGDDDEVGGNRDVYAAYLLERESRTAHGDVILRYLQQAVDKTNPLYQRRRGFYYGLLAEQWMASEQYTKAMDCLQFSTALLCKEQFILPAVAGLTQLVKCAIALGRPVELFYTVMTLYANAAKEHLSRHEVEALHLHVLCLLEATAVTSISATTSTSTSIATVSGEAAKSSSASAGTTTTTTTTTTRSLSSQRRPSSFTNTTANGNSGGPMGALEKPTGIGEDGFQLQKMRVRNRESFLTSTYVPLMLRPEYGAQATAEAVTLESSNGDEGPQPQDELKPVQYSLPVGFEAMMGSNMKMFTTKVKFNRKVAEIGQSILVTLSIKSSFIDEMVFDELRVYFTNAAVVTRIVSVDHLTPEELSTLPHACRPRSAATPTSTSSSSSVRGCLNERESGVASGATNEAEFLSNEDVILASLAFPPNEYTHFSFRLYLSEPGFREFFTASDAVFCLERIELLLYGAPLVSSLAALDRSSGNNNGGAVSNNNINSNNNIDSDVSNSGNRSDTMPTPPYSPKNSRSSRAGTVDASVLPDQRNDAKIIFHVNALPLAVQHASNVPGNKTYTLKDNLDYCRVDDFDAVEVKKATPLISILEPTQTVNLLQGIVQRVNVYLKINQNDLLDGYVYLASDYNPLSSEEALFWYPDKTALARILVDTPTGTRSPTGTSRDDPSVQDGWISDEMLNDIPFHPITLNDSMQPAQPVHIPPYTHSGESSVVCVPLFLKSDIAIKTTLQLRVEFVPRRILTSSLTKDFSVKVSFLPPFDMKFSLPRNGSFLDQAASAVVVDEVNTLSASLVCVNALQNAIGVTDMAVFLEDEEEEAAGAVEENSGTAENSKKDDSNHNKQKFEIVGKDGSRYRSISLLAPPAPPRVAVPPEPSVEQGVVATAAIVDGAAVDAAVATPALPAVPLQSNEVLTKCVNIVPAASTTATAARRPTTTTSTTTTTLVSQNSALYAATGRLLPFSDFLKQAAAPPAVAADSASSSAAAAATSENASADADGAAGQVKRRLHSLGEIQVTWRILGTHTLRYRGISTLNALLGSPLSNADLLVSSFNNNTSTTAKESCSIIDSSIEGDVVGTELVSPMTPLSPGGNASSAASKTVLSMGGAAGASGGARAGENAGDVGIKFPAAVLFGEFEWLLSLGMDQDQEPTRPPREQANTTAVYDVMHLDRSVATTCVRNVSFPIPALEIQSRPFITEIIAPSQGKLQQLISMQLVIRSHQASQERLRVNAVLNDYFLLAGSTLTIVEVPAYGTAQISLTLVPLQAGSVPLPNVAVVWDRGLNNSMTLFETGTSPTAPTAPSAGGGDPGRNNSSNSRNNNTPAAAAAADPPPFGRYVFINPV